MNPVFLLAAKDLWSTWWRALLIVALTSPATFLLGQCHGRALEHDQQQLAIAQDKAAQAARERAADVTLTNTASNQAAAIAVTRKETDDALSAIPDARPTARQHARACLELRRQAAAARRPEPAC